MAIVASSSLLSNFLHRPPDKKNEIKQKNQKQCIKSRKEKEEMEEEKK